MHLDMNHPPRPTLPGRRLLVLQNPGRGSRNYLSGIIQALRQMGIAHCVVELQEIWNSKASPQTLVRRVSEILIEQRIGAVVGYGFNGLSDMPCDGGPMGTLRSFFEIRGIPHLMLWLDHPQWHADLVGLSPQLQGMFRSANCYHFLKSAGHALELERILGWPHCFALPAGVGPEQFPVHPNAGIHGLVGPAEFDLVAICSENGTLPEWLSRFLRLEAPDPDVIRQTILRQVRSDLAGLWKREIPDSLRAEVTELGERWALHKAADPFVAAFRHWPALAERFPGAAWYLTMNYPTYMKALRILWRLREWERQFFLAYLAQHFRVGVFGGDWSALGMGPGGRIDFDRQSETYARGRVALNITDGHDEEGLTMKPFEIAASGIPMLHYRAAGLEECFAPAEEVAVFSTPREAREKLDALLESATLRQQMATAARERVLRQHTWEHRVAAMFRLARLPLAAFMETGVRAVQGVGAPAGAA